MFTQVEIKDYETLNKMLKSLVEDETDRIANLANASSLLNMFLKDINWVGFYLYQEETNELVLGPFQGLPACVTIENGKGVCGTAFRGNDIFIVDDVNEFLGILLVTLIVNQKLCYQFIKMVLALGFLILMRQFIHVSLKKIALV